MLKRQKPKPQNAAAVSDADADGCGMKMEMEMAMQPEAVAYVGGLTVRHRHHIIVIINSIVICGTIIILIEIYVCFYAAA